MKKLFSTLLIAAALLFVTNATAQTLTIQNSQSCAYTVYVFEGLIGTCNLTLQYFPVTVPPGAVVNYTAAAGSWVVGTCVEELWPVPGTPPIFGCTGVSNPTLGMSCAGYPPTAFAGGTCGPNPTLVQGFASFLFI
ncbi:MAG: hypothetical protein ACFB10_09885 [Salibacteraceae bacterium]